MSSPSNLDRYITVENYTSAAKEDHPLKITHSFLMLLMLLILLIFVIFLYIRKQDS